VPVYIISFLVIWPIMFRSYRPTSYRFIDILPEMVLNVIDAVIDWTLCMLCEWDNKFSTSTYCDRRSVANAGVQYAQRVFLL